MYCYINYGFCIIVEYMQINKFKPKLYTIIQQGQKAKLDYHLSMLFAYMKGVGVRGFKMFCQRGQNFFYSLCVGGWGGGRLGGGQVQYLSFREKNNRPPSPPHPINK